MLSNEMKHRKMENECKESEENSNIYALPQLAHSTSYALITNDGSLKKNGGPFGIKDNEDSD